MSLRAVFFDLDDTLCDETSAWKACTAETAARAASQVPGLSAPDLAQAYLDHSDAFWRALDPSGGLPPLVTLRARLWATALRAIRVENVALAEELARDYGERRGTYPIALFSEALPLLAALRQSGKTLVLITNGVQETHRERIAMLGLEPYFHHVLISDVVGCAKPDPRIFHHALALAGCAPHEAMMVGDNPINDVLGAQAVGIPAVWFNPHGHPLPAGVPEPLAGAVGSLPALHPILLA